MKRSTRSRTASALVEPRAGTPLPNLAEPRSPRHRHQSRVRANARRHAQLFVSGLVIIIAGGHGVPGAPMGDESGQRTPVVDAFFTAVSAASVTGLSVVDTLEHWNWWGQVVLLAADPDRRARFHGRRQHPAADAASRRRCVHPSRRALLKDGSPALSIQEAVSLAGRIVRFTFVAEVIGRSPARHLVWHSRRVATTRMRSGTASSTR